MILGNFFLFSPFFHPFPFFFLTHNICQKCQNIFVRNLTLVGNSHHLFVLLFRNSSAPPPGLPHQGGGTVFPRPWWEGLGEGAELVRYFVFSFASFAPLR